jgi:hypothetical protein
MDGGTGGLEGDPDPAPMTGGWGRLQAVSSSLGGAGRLAVLHRVLKQEN